MKDRGKENTARHTKKEVHERCGRFDSNPEEWVSLSLYVALGMPTMSSMISGDIYTQVQSVSHKTFPIYFAEPTR